MNKLVKLIRGLGKDELLLIKRDLVAGNIDREINRRLMEFAQEEHFSEKTCPVCGGKITSDAYKLEFGKDYLRKKAYFDGVDCLEYFSKTKLKAMKKENY